MFLSLIACNNKYSLAKWNCETCSKTFNQLAWKVNKLCGLTRGKTEWYMSQNYLRKNPSLHYYHFVLLNYAQSFEGHLGEKVFISIKNFVRFTHITVKKHEKVNLTSLSQIKLLFFHENWCCWKSSFFEELQSLKIKANTIGSSTTNAFSLFFILSTLIHDTPFSILLSQI